MPTESPRKKMVASKTSSPDKLKRRSDGNIRRGPRKRASKNPYLGGRVKKRKTDRKGGKEHEGVAMGKPNEDEKKVAKKTKEVKVVEKKECCMTRANDPDIKVVKVVKVAKRQCFREGGFASQKKYTFFVDIMDAMGDAMALYADETMVQNWKEVEEIGSFGVWSPVMAPVGTGHDYMEMCYIQKWWDMKCCCAAWIQN